MSELLTAEEATDSILQAAGVPNPPTKPLIKLYLEEWELQIRMDQTTKIQRKLKLTL